MMEKWIKAFLVIIITVFVASYILGLIFNNITPFEIKSNKMIDIERRLHN